MIYSKRKLETRIFKAFKDGFVTGIIGPRRVGKSTLIDHYIEQHPNIEFVRLNMDRMDVRNQAKAGNLEAMILMASQRQLTPAKRLWVTIDEAQKCPELFEQIKVLYDRYKDQDAIKFIITGSALLELHRLSAESLAGRIKLFHLSAFGLAETVTQLTQISIKPSVFDLIENNYKTQAWNAYFHAILPFTQPLKEALITLQIWGGLPEILILKTREERLDYLANYLQTYLEKDIRAIHTITDVSLYRNLMEIIAEQTGSVRDDDRILTALGCHRATLQKYRGFLEATLLFEQIPPYINSSLKRLIKSPKGYLTNNGLISYLTGLDDYNILLKTGQIGHRLENWFLNELLIWLSQTPLHSRIHFWRTSAGVEVDFVVKKGVHIYPFEITHSTAIERKKITNLIRFLEYEPKAKYGFYIYMGDFKIDHEKNIIFIPAWTVC